MGDRLDIAAPCHAHNLHGLVDHRVPAALLQIVQSGSDFWRSQIVKQNDRILLCQRLTGDRILERGGRIVIAVDEDQRPLARVRCR
jgi:hypothetical protein